MRSSMLILNYYSLLTDNVDSIDHEGAKKAKQKKDILSVVINEKFYSVHSKAQRKVVDLTFMTTFCIQCILVVICNYYYYYYYYYLSNEIN